MWRLRCAGGFPDRTSAMASHCKPRDVVFGFDHFGAGAESVRGRSSQILVEKRSSYAVIHGTWHLTYCWDVHGTWE